jgi:hypothetical protein
VPPPAVTVPLLPLAPQEGEVPSHRIGGYWHGNSILLRYFLYSGGVD